jgi:hypothetical protein
MADGAVETVPVRFRQGTAGAPRVVVPASAFGERRVTEFDMSPDSRRFYFDTADPVDELTLILDWQTLLNRAR